MGKIRDLTAQLKTVTIEGEENKILGIIQETQSELIRLNKQQLFESEDSNQEPLGDYASIEYANKKGRATVDLKLKGGFYAGIFVNAQKFPILFGSTDSKTPDLLKRWGEVLGLTKPSLATYNKVTLLAKVQSFFRGLLHV